MAGNGPLSQPRRYEKTRQRIEGEDPAWLTTVPHAEVVLDCRWPRVCPSRILRGAIIAQVEEQIGASVEWHNHGDDGEASARPALTYFRTGRRPSVWFWGHTAHDRAAWLCARLHALRLPGGEIVEVEGADMQTGATGVQLCGKTWYTYDLITPIFPSFVVFARRPSQPGAARRAWATSYLQTAVLDWIRNARAEIRREPLQTWGGQIHPAVYIHDHDDIDSEQRVSWERPERGERIDWKGFRCRFTVNAVLPDGVGLGRHRSEGFGELRLVGHEGRA